MSEASGDQQPRPRDLMPLVWQRIAKYREQWGKEHVAECIRRGMAGEPDWFYAVENGYVVGTPFQADQVTVDCLRLSVALGGKFAVVMRAPKEAPANGAN
jgi:hypothetical protein